MIFVNKRERKALESFGLLKERKVGNFPQDANFCVVNKQHKSRTKKTFVAETPEVMRFLGHYDKCNLQKITKNQLDKLIEAKLVTEDKIQEYGKYIPNALAYRDGMGGIYVEKIANIMLFLNIWKPKKSFKKN